MSSRKNLTSLHTAFGTRSVYDSVSFCNRCGMCAPGCPSYQQTQQEPFSPRGRNQAFRLILERKLKIKSERALLREMTASCTLCGRCVQSCPGKIPTPQHMLELRRRLNMELLPRTLVYLLRLRQASARLFTCLMKIGLQARRLGLLHIGALVPGLTWLKHALAIIPRSAAISTKGAIKRPTLIYLPSFEAQFLMPDLFQKTYQLATKKHRVLVWQDSASGLFEYVYGDLRRARKQVHLLMARHARIAGGKLPVLTDSIDVYNFLVQAAQLFEGFPTLKQQAVKFVSCVRFVTDLLPPKIVKKRAWVAPVQLMPSALFSVEAAPLVQAQEILRTLFKKNFVQCGYKDVIVPPLGYGFVKHTRAPEYVKSAVQTVATHQTQTVFVLSGLASLELAFYMRKFYPAAQVRHIIDLNG